MAKDKYGLVTFDGDVAKKLIEKLSDAAGWVATHDTPKRIAVKTYIEEIQNSNYSPVEKAALISNAKKIIKEYSNQNDVLKLALESMDSNADPYNVDDDWLATYMDKVKMISDLDFQLMWSKILVGEIESPGSFSIRTLENLKRMSKRDAETLLKLAAVSFYVGNSAYISNKLPAGIKLEDIMRVAECGLMSETSVNLSVKVGTNQKANIYTKNIFGNIEVKEHQELTIDLSVYCFTISGVELLSAINYESDDNMIKELKKDLESKYEKINISLHEITSINKDGRIQYKVNII